MAPRPSRISTSATLVLLLAGVPLAVATASVADAAPTAAIRATPPEPTTSFGTPTDLGALYIGAHPDDEAGTLSTLGAWKQLHGVQTGVVTITRGEGGGNAVGTQEGPALGLLREDEERRAVGKAGVTDIFNLDEVDFYYTVSQPLTRQTWGHEETLGKLVRVIRTTRPEVLVTMNPAPAPGNHGHHQEAARLAVEAYQAAGDPSRFPEQITRERLRPFAPKRILTRSVWGTQAEGERCAAGFAPEDPTQNTFGVWGGLPAPEGRTWAAVEREAQRTYVSQGWAGFPDVATDPAALGCDMMTQLAARVPFPEPESAAATSTAGALHGALTRAPGAVPLGTGLELTSSVYRALPGTPFTVRATVTAPPKASLRRAAVALDVPSGWKVSGRGALGTLRPGVAATTTFTITPPRGATLDERVRLAARLTSRDGTGYTDTPVLVSPPVTAHQQYLPQVSDFVAWATANRLPQFTDIVRPALAVPAGRSRAVDYVLENHTDRPQETTLAVTPPAGFEVSTTSPRVTVPAKESATLTATVRSTDAAAPTSMYGGEQGDHLYDIAATTRAGAKATARNAFQLVPTTTIPRAGTAPVVDGKLSAGEYSGPALDLSRRWEGDECTSGEDCSATAKVTWNDDTLFLAVTVTDDVAGTALAANDCKRHWRTDAVEIAIDPQGTSENTSSTFKAAILPFTKDGGACYLRDADNTQGDGPTTAPGMKVASTVNAPYTGYTVETSIPMSLLPGAVDPDHMGLNILPYDSDTQDKTGQTRIGWSVWGGVQGDPYRWGVATLDGYTPPSDRPTTAPDPVMPLSALDSLDSPPSIEQAVRTNVALAGRPASTLRAAGWAERARLRGDTASVWVRANGAGTAHVTVRDGTGVLASRTEKVLPGRSRVDLRLPRAVEGTATVTLGWSDGTGTTASTLPLR